MVCVAHLARLGLGQPFTTRDRECRMEHDEYSSPPGCKVAILAHPSGVDESLDLALFHDHRYAFFFWSIWTRNLGLQENRIRVDTMHLSILPESHCVC